MVGGETGLTAGAGQLDDDARSHPDRREVTPPRLVHPRTHHGPRAGSGPWRQDWLPHGNRHCPPDGKRPSHHPVLPPPPDRSRVRSCSGAVGGDYTGWEGVVIDRAKWRCADRRRGQDFRATPGGTQGVKTGVKLAPYSPLSRPSSRRMPGSSARCHRRALRVPNHRPGDGRRRSTPAEYPEPWIPIFIGMTDREKGASGSESVAAASLAELEGASSARLERVWRCCSPQPWLARASLGARTQAASPSPAAQGRMAAARVVLG